MFHSKKPVSIGIDISEKNIKGVLLEKQPDGFAIVAYTLQEIPQGILSEKEINDPKQMGEYIERVVRELQEGHLHHTIISVALPETETFLTTLTLHTAETSPEALAPLIQEEIKQHIPIDSEHLLCDWQIIEQTPTSSVVAVAAAPREAVTTFTSIFSSQKIIPLAFEIESIAIARAVIPMQSPPKNTTIIVDIGARRSGLSLVHGTTVHTAVSAPLSTTSIIDAIAHSAKISNTEAEQLFFSFGAQMKSAPQPYIRAVSSALHDVVTRIQDMAQFSQTHLYELPPECILLTGGGARMRDSAPYLAQELNIEVREADPLANIIHSLSHPCPIPPHERHYFTTAVGLALRSAITSSV